MNPPAYPHLHPALRDFADKDDATRIARIRTERWIEHPPAARVLELLQEAFEQPERGRMDNLLLLGESGMGKTALVQAFERRQAVPWNAALGLRRRPVLVVLMPDEPTEAAFFSQVLASLDVPPFARGFAPGPSRRELAFRFLREMGTRVLVLDEINSVLAGTARQQRLFLQLLRFLSNELRVALVCTGVPEARHALMSDAQLRSRFAEIEMPPWSASPELQEFVNRIVQGFPLRQPSPVEGAKVCRLLAERSGGVTLRVCKALERAAIAAIRSGRECIDLAALEDAVVWRGMAPPGLGLRLRAAAWGQA